jgi:hypothetical protein
LVAPILIEVEVNMIFFIKSAFLLNTPRIEEEEEENGETKEKDHVTCWVLQNRSWCIPVCSKP